jgi:DNA-binding phage protein
MVPKNIREENPETFAEIIRVAKAMGLSKGIYTIESLAFVARIAGRVEVAEELKKVWQELLVVRDNPQLQTVLSVIITKLEERFGSLSRFQILTRLGGTVDILEHIRTAASWLPM